MRWPYINIFLKLRTLRVCQSSCFYHKTHNSVIFCHLAAPLSRLDSLHSLVSRSSAEFILITCVSVTLDLPRADMCSYPIAILRDSRPSSHLIPVYVSALVCWYRICTSVTRDYLHRVVKLCEGGLLKYILITAEKDKPC